MIEATNKTLKKKIIKLKMMSNHFNNNIKKKSYLKKILFKFT